MRVALCLHGYIANTNGINGAIMANQYIKDKILNGNNVDIFIHSWDIPNKDLALDLYNPKCEQFEQQKDFSKELTSYNQSWFFEGKTAPPGMYSTNTIYRGLSFLYSRKRCIEIKAEYEKENNFAYDCVIVTRFDLGMRGKEHPQKYYATDIHFNSSFEMKKIYSCFWAQLNWGIADHWFYSNSANIDKVASLYDYAVRYYQPDSEYVKRVTTGWPDSNEQNEFSNEILKSNKVSELVKFPRWGCIDNHKLYKWHFMETGLYKKSAFVDPNNGEVYEKSR